MTTVFSDAPAPAGDGFLRVEDHGIEPIPAGERHGRSRELAFLWAGAFVNYASLLTASLATSFFGLGVWDGLAATLLGTVAGALVLGLLSHGGPRSGLPQVAFTRRVFGAAGMRAGAVLTLFLAVGWFAVDTVIAAQAGVQLLGMAGLGRAAGTLVLPLVLAIAALSVVAAVYGHRTVMIFEKFGAVAFAGLSLALFLLLAPQFRWGTGPTAAGAAYLGAFVLGFMVCFALVASWYPFASDYSRYLPEATPRRGLTWWPVVGVTLPMALLGLFGLLLPTIDRALASSQGVLAVITGHAPAWMAIPFFVFVVLGEVWANYLDVYTAGLVALTMGLRLRRWQTALGCGVVGAALAAYAVVYRDFHTAYEQFLLLTYLWAPAWAAIVLLAMATPGPRRAGAALAAWAAATAVSLLFVNYPNIYPNATVPNQPLIDALHGADLSGLVSMAVAAAVYLSLSRLRGRPSPAVDPGAG
jgi:NCS1 family nucleobase:cation symporter-1